MPDALAEIADGLDDVAIVALDPTGRVTHWNTGACRLTGLERDEAVGRELAELLATVADGDPPAGLTVEAARAGRVEDEMPVRRRDGATTTARLSLDARRRADGEVAGFSLVGRDRTVQEELEHLGLAVASIRDYAIFLLDPDGRVATWNDGARRLKGYEPDEIIGEHFSRFYTEPDLESGFPATELEVAARVGRFEDEGWRVRNDGTRFWANVVITAVREESGRLIGFAKVTRDLTGRRAAEEELRRTAVELEGVNREIGTLRLAIANISDYAIFLLDLDGRVATWNEGARRLKGYEPDEIIGEHFSRFYTEEHLARDFPAYELEVASRDGRFEDEGWRVRKDGTRFWANVVITAVRDEAGQHVGFAKVTRDLTQRRRAEEALRATAEELERANGELDRFAAAAAHDLVQPLHTIVGLVDVIRARPGTTLDDYTAEALGHMRTAGLRLADRVEALLRYARTTRGGLAVADVALDAVADNVEAALRGEIEERGAVVERDGPLGTVRADAALIELVLQNLVENALKFHQGSPRVRIGASAEGTERRVTVADDGIGIDAGERDRIFQLFTRAGAESDYTGSGMGLAMCRQIVERHDGRIGVDGNPGGGSTFWFTLPSAGPADAP